MIQLQDVLEASYIHIHRRYSILTRFFSQKQPLLKTDLWNELRTDYPIAANHYIEFDAEMVDEAVHKGLPATLCSITDISLPDNSVSTLIDFSTLDHIPDPLPALREYSRVLKKSPLSHAYIICWTGDSPVEQMQNWSGPQYYFNRERLIRDFEAAGFVLLDSGKFLGIGDESKILEFYHLQHKQVPLLMKSQSIVQSIVNQLAFGNKRTTVDREMKGKYIRFDKESMVTSSGISGVQIQQHRINFHSADADPWIVIPETLPTGKMVMVMVDLTLPVGGIIQLFYLPEGIGLYSEEHSIPLRIGAGRQQQDFLIPDTRLHGRLRLDPGNAPGAYTIHCIRILTR